jgi:hypothetical protein
LRPGDLAKATKKLAEANKKRLKKLGLSPTVQPTSSAVQETRPVVLAPPAVKETQPVAQPVPTVVQSTPQAVQQTQSVVQPTPSTVQTTPQAVQETIPVVQHSQVTAPTVAQATTPPSLEEENHLHDVDGGQRDVITKIMIHPMGKGYYICLFLVTFIKKIISYTIYFSFCRFTPSKAAANAMKMALRDKFRNVYQCWKKVPQDEWFKTFSVSLAFVFYFCLCSLFICISVSIFACILDMIQFSNLIKISSEIVEASNCVVPMLLHDSFANWTNFTLFTSN